MTCTVDPAGNTASRRRGGRSTRRRRGGFVRRGRTPRSPSRRCARRGHPRRSAPAAALAGAAPRADGPSRGPPWQRWRRRAAAGPAAVRPPQPAPRPERPRRAGRTRRSRSRSRRRPAAPRGPATAHGSTPVLLEIASDEWTPPGGPRCCPAGGGGAGTRAGPGRLAVLNVAVAPSRHLARGPPSAPGGPRSGCGPGRDHQPRHDERAGDNRRTGRAEFAHHRTYQDQHDQGQDQQAHIAQGERNRQRGPHVGPGPGQLGDQSRILLREPVRDLVQDLLLAV